MYCGTLCSLMFESSMKLHGCKGSTWASSLISAVENFMKLHGAKGASSDISAE